MTAKILFSITFPNFEKRKKGTIHPFKKQTTESGN